MAGDTEKLYILMVDDDPDMLSLLAQMVELAGHEPGHASSGAEAIALARQRPPDVVVLDIMMANTDGWTVYNQLRDFTNAPVLFLTAWRTNENEARARELGERFASKPIALKELRKLLDEAIEEARAARSA